MSEYRDIIARLAYNISKWGKDGGGSRLKGYKRRAAGGKVSHSSEPSDVPPVKSHTFPTSKQPKTNETE
jgi:hypothetical protein